MDNDLAGRILIALLAAAGALLAGAGGAFLNNVLSSRQAAQAETRAEKRKARDLYLEEAEAFNRAVARFLTFLRTHTLEELRELPASGGIAAAHRAVLEPVHEMAILANTGLSALGTPDSVRKLFPKVTDLLAQMQQELVAEERISHETTTAVMDGIADIRKAVIEVKDSYGL